MHLDSNLWIHLPPYKYKRSWLIEGIQSINQYDFLYFLPLSLYFYYLFALINLSQTLDCCYSFVPMMFKDVVLPMLGQPKVCLPHQVSSRLSIPWCALTVPGGEGQYEGCYEESPQATLGRMLMCNSVFQHQHTLVTLVGQKSNTSTTYDNHFRQQDPKAQRI